jgi:hypothetical protein
MKATRSMEKIYTDLNKFRFSTVLVPNMFLVNNFYQTHAE